MHVIAAVLDRQDPRAGRTLLWIAPGRRGPLLGPRRDGGRLQALLCGPELLP